MPMNAKRKMKRDKTLVWSLVIIVLCTVLGGGITFGVQYMSDNLADTLISDLQTVPEEDEAEVVPVVLTGKQTPARVFLEKIKEYEPKNATKTQVKDTGSASTPVSWICGRLAFNPSPANGVQVFTKEGHNVIVQTFGAGQSNTVLQQYRKGINNCAQRDGVARTLTASPGLANDAEGFTYTISQDKKQTTVTVWVRGDAMMTVATSNYQTTTKIANEYDQVILAGLTETKCLSIDGKLSDKTRSPFYNTEDYTGWQRGRGVKIPETAAGITVGYRPLTGQPLHGAGAFIGDVPVKSPTDGRVPINVMYMNVTKPEAPLPADYKQELPKKIIKPTVPKVTKPGEPILNTKIQERVIDTDGPSCGWVWSGQVMPEFDPTDEKARADQAERVARQTLVNDVVANMNQYSNWYNQMLEYNLAATAWVKSVKEYNDTAAKWHSLNQIRADYRARLDAYYKLVEARDAFIEQQEKAQKEYDLAVSECLARVDQPDGDGLDQEVPVPPITASPEPIDPTLPSEEPTQPPSEEEPEDCSLIERPTILDEEVPPVPVPPKKPNVPLPASWDDVPAN